MSINSLAIFCGSRVGNNGLYAQHAKELGNILAKQKVETVYGGGKKGLMGIIADGIMQSGGIVRGVIPEILAQWEHQHNNITELFVVEDMHQRKRKMYELCDAAIILPGGFGTLDELFEIVTWNQLSIHNKQIFILNSGGFYQHLLQHLTLLAREGFLYRNLDEVFTILEEPADLISHL